MSKNTNAIVMHQQRVNSFHAVLKLFNRYYLKSFFGPFFSFIFPILIYAILGAIMDYKTMLPGIVSMTSMSVGLTGLPFSIMELKKSVLLKRIGASPVKPWIFTVTMVAYFLLVILLSILWLLLWALIITRDPKIFQPMGTVTGFFGFWFGNLINIVTSISLGFLIASISKNEMQAQAIGMLIMFPSQFLSGQFLSPEVIAKNEAMQWISRFIPFRYTTMIISESWYGDFKVSPELAIFGATDQIGNPFKIHEYQIFKLPDLNEMLKDGRLAKYIQDGTKVQDMLADSKLKMRTLWDKADHICGYIVPYVLTALNISFAVKKFSWSAAR